MGDSISRLMCCGLALLNFTQSISHSYRCKCAIQQAQLCVLTWKRCISFPARINQVHASHVQHLAVNYAFMIHWHFVRSSAQMGHQGPPAPTQGTMLAHLREKPAWCWHSGGSRCSLLCLWWAKLYTQFLKTTRMFVRFCCVHAGLENPQLPVIKVCIEGQARGERAMCDACPRSSFRSVHSQLTHNWLLINCVDLYFWAQSNFIWAKRPC